MPSAASPSSRENRGSNSKLDFQLARDTSTAFDRALRSFVLAQRQRQRQRQRQQGKATAIGRWRDLSDRRSPQQSPPAAPFFARNRGLNSNPDFEREKGLGGLASECAAPLMR